MLATGSQVRRLSLPGFDQDGVFYLAPWLTSMVSVRLTPGKRLVIIGGGYIGLEVAAVARKLAGGHRVGNGKAHPGSGHHPAMSAFYTKVHTDHGVVIKTEAAAAALSGEGQVTGVQCKDGTETPRTW